MPTSDAITSRLREFVDTSVHGPLSAAGYERRGRVWAAQRDGLRRVVDLQQERTRGSEPAVDFTLNCGIVVDGANAYNWGALEDEDQEASGGQLQTRIGEALQPPSDWWFRVTATTVTAGPIFGPHTPTDGDELRHALRSVVVPTLARFESALDVDTFLGRQTEHDAPFVQSLFESGMPMTRRAVQAARAWQDADRPLLDVRAEPLGDFPAGVRIVLPTELVAERPDIAAHFLGWSTPLDICWRVRKVTRPQPNVVELLGSRIDGQGLAARYRNFVSLRLFDPTPLEPGHRNVGDQYDPALANLREVEVGRDEETGAIRVTFDDFVAHEHADLVAACVDLCRQTAGVRRAWQEDRELILLEGTGIDARKLGTALRRFVRAEIRKSEQNFAP